MKKFNIEVITKKPKKIYGLPAYEGRITIDNFWETLYMPIDSWNIEQYKNQWRKGIERLKRHDVSCLVITVQNLSIKPHINLWAFYKVGNTIFIQNQLLNTAIARELNLTTPLSHFNSKICYQFVSPRITNNEGKGVTEEGEIVSEWSVPLSSLENLIIE